MKDHECKFTPIPAKTIDWYNGVEKNLFTTCCDTCKAAGPINIKKKPTLRQIAYVFKAIADHLKDPGSYMNPDIYVVGSSYKRIKVKADSLSEAESKAGNIMAEHAFLRDYTSVELIETNEPDFLLG